MYVQDATIDILCLFIFFKTKFMFPIGRLKLLTQESLIITSMLLAIKDRSAGHRSLLSSCTRWRCGITRASKALLALASPTQEVDKVGLDNQVDHF